MVTSTLYIFSGQTPREIGKIFSFLFEANRPRCRLARKKMKKVPDFTGRCPEKNVQSRGRAIIFCKTRRKDITYAHIWRFSMRIILVLFFSVCTFGICQADNSPPVPKLVVNGSSMLHKPADQVTMSISVISQSERAEDALLDNNVGIQKVLDSIK